MSSKKEADVPGSTNNVELHRAESIPDHNVKNEHLSKSQQTVVCVGQKAARCVSVLKYVRAEVIMFMYMFSYIMRAVSNSSLIMDKVCYVHLGYSEGICANLKDFKDIKTQVEKIANNYSLGHGLIQMLPSSIISCFIGAWSDRYGRKLPIIVALVGIIIDGIGSSFCAAVFYSRVEYLYIAAAFTGLSGGFISVLTVLYSYAADVTTFNKRTMKYAIMEMSFGISMPLGSLVGGWLFRGFGYPAVFITSASGHILALIWVMLMLEETKGLDNTDSWGVKLKTLFSFKPVMESFRATVKPRPNKGRAQILLLIVAMSCAVLTLASTAGISFLYVHHQFDWDNTKYSTISAILSMFGLVAMMIAVPLFKRYKMGDSALGILGSTSMLTKNIGMGVASRPGIYFAANIAGIMTGVATLAGRSRISKVTSKDDIGKVFSFLTTAESLLPIIATAIVSQVFNATLEILPGMIYLVLGSLMFIPLGVFIWMAFLPKVNYEEMHNNDETQQEKAANDIENNSDT